MKKILLFSSLLCYLQCSFSQDFSNKGKDFWVGYGYHEIMVAGNSQQMVLYFATDQVTTITISIPGNGYTQTLTSGALPTVLTSAPIPKSGAQDVTLQAASTSPENKGIHIVADKPIVAYAHIYNMSVSGACILFPTNTLGKEYYSINYTNISNTDNANCWFYVVAADTGVTTVEITPIADCINHPAGIPFTVTLTQGQIYNVMGILTGGGGPGGINTGVDLTGSKIKSISSGTGSCKKIAVFSGSGRIVICTDAVTPSSDNYMVQAFPKAAWGKKFLTVHTNILTNNIYRICVSDPAAVVKVNGVPVAVPLQNNFYYEIAATSTHLKIESDLPITVAQYITSQSACNNTAGGTQGDPEVIYLSPVEQNISKVLWNATPNNAITQHFFNVVLPNSGTAISSFKLDGTLVASSAFTVHPQDPAYSYLIRSVSQGQHTIESDSGFNAIAYGYGSFESYGFNAGTNIKDLYNFLTPINPLSISPDPVACTGTDFYFSVTFPFQPTSLVWNFHNSPFLSPNANPVTTPDPTLILDGTYFIGTRQVWRYKLPGLYHYIPANSSPGYPVTITAGTTSTEGCGNTFDRDFNLAVYDPPVANYTWVNNGCVTDSVRFTDATNYVAGTYSYKWFWDFGDGTTALVRNPSHLYTTPGSYTVKFALISNVGCLSDTAKKIITVSPLPTATITGTTAVCKNAPSPLITLTGTVGTAPFKFTYTINAGPELVATTISGNSITVSVPTTTVGTYIYSLIGVQGQNCYQDQVGTATVIVNPLPAATIAGNATVCKNATSPLITFSGAGSTAPYKFIYNINGGANLTVTTVSGNSVTVAAPTGVTGTFTYTLVSVQDGSATACLLTQTGNVTVTVRSLPTATISGTTSLCLNAGSPNITFSGSNGTAPYIFTYNINGGPDLTVTTTGGNTAVVNVPATTAGTFTYTLISVKESGSTTCSQAQAGTVAVTVWPLPTAGFSYSTPSCTARTINFLDGSSANAGLLNEWHWDFGEPSSGALNTSTSQNPSHIFASPGTYPVKLYVKTSNGCQSLVLTSPVIVNPRPTAGFINPEVCLSDTYAQFTDTSTVPGGSVVAWLWNFDDPASGSANSSVLQNPQHSYTTIGTKNVKLIVTSLSGCKDTILQSFFVNGDVPVADFLVLNAAGLCANDSVNIANTSTVDVGSVVKVEIFWDNAGAPAASEIDDYPYPNKQYAHLYPDFQSPPLSKNYQVRFRAYSGATCIDDKFQNIVLNASPKVVFNPIPDTCLNISPFPILQATEISGIPGTFIFSGNGISPTGIFNPALVGPGTYIIHYSFTSNKGCMDSGQRVIKILPAPVANFGYKKPACETQTVLFSDSSSAAAGFIAIWTWNFGDGTPAIVRNDGVPFTHTFTIAGNYHVTLTVTTNKGCNSLLKDLLVKISPLPNVDFHFSDTVCLPSAKVQFFQQASIADGTENAFTYTWNFGDGSAASYSPNPVHSYSTVGPFNVTLMVKSVDGCTGQLPKVVNTIHPQPTAQFGFNKPSVCIGDNVGFIDNSDPKDGSVLSLYWDFGDHNSSIIPSPANTYSAEGIFIVTHYIINSFGCNSDTITKPFPVYPYPVVNAGEDQVVLEGEAIALVATAKGDGLKYSWTKDVNVSTDLHLSSSTVLSPKSTPVEDMNYTITVTGKGGCPASDQVKVKVLKTPRIPNTFSPNNDGINDLWEIEYLKAYPLAKVQVFTRAGQIVFESHGYRSPWDGTLKGKSLPPDTYYYIIEPASGRLPVTGYVTIIK